MSRRRGGPVFDPFPADEGHGARRSGPSAATLGVAGLVAALVAGVVLLGGVDGARAVPGAVFDRAVGYFDRWAEARDAAGAPTTAPVAAGMRGYAPAEAGRAVAAPVAVEIPSVGIRSGLERLDLDADGAIETPDAWQSAGWYRRGTRPGQQGAAVILGHVDSSTGPAVFARLRDVRPGARVRVRRADGSVAVFAVDRLEQHRKTRFPTADVYFPTPDPTLRLVTCTGDFDRDRGSYRDNLVVFATLVAERG